MIRNRSRSAAVIVASRIALYIRRRRRLPTDGATRITTCSGCDGLKSGRAAWRSPARDPLGLRPAPRRLPPRRNSDCWTCRFRMTAPYAFLCSFATDWALLKYDILSGNRTHLMTQDLE